MGCGRRSLWRCWPTGASGGLIPARLRLLLYVQIRSRRGQQPPWDFYGRHRHQGCAGRLDAKRSAERQLRSDVSQTAVSLTDVHAQTINITGASVGLTGPEVQELRRRQ
jgi:hypothetical protein